MGPSHTLIAFVSTQHYRISINSSLKHHYHPNRFDNDIGRSWFWHMILDLLMFIGMPRLETSRLWQNTWVVIIYITFSSLASKRCLDQIKLNAKNTLSSKAWYHGASTERALEAMCLSYANWIGDLQKMYANQHIHHTVVGCILSSINGHNNSLCKNLFLVLLTFCNLF